MTRVQNEWSLRGPCSWFQPGLIKNPRENHTYAPERKQHVEHNILL